MQKYKKSVAIKRTLICNENELINIKMSFKNKGHFPNF